MKGTKGRAGQTGRKSDEKKAATPAARDKTHNLLRQIVARMTADRALREDLFQEASVHLWLRQKGFPGQTQSWYLKSCRFYLQNLLRNGRSVDSAKRSARACAVSEAEEEQNALHPLPIDKDSVLGVVSAREIAESLQKSLTPVECRVFAGLAEGSGVREIASQLRVSHTSVIRYRSKIALLALRLGVEPLPKWNRRDQQQRPA